MLTKNQISALRIVIDALNKNRIKYQISGGLAAILYGSKRKLHDIDIDVNKKDFKKAQRIFKNYIYKKPRRFIDKKWDIYLMTLKINNVSIDISRVEDMYITPREGVKIKLKTDLSKAKKIRVYGIDLYIEPIEDLIIYKTLLGRKTDIKDVKSLSRLR